MKRKIILLSILVSGMMVATGVLLVQGGGTSAAANGFGFKKNIEHRKSADTESVLGCMASCQEMLAGWSEMNPDSKNYVRQQEKIAAKAEQCLGMNELAGFPFSEEEILASCGQDQCLTDVDCDDGNSCTVNHCVLGPSRFGQGNTCVTGNIVGFPPGTPVECSINGATGVCADGQCTTVEPPPSCIEVSQEEVHSGACKDLSFIETENLPQCCSLEGQPSGDLLCGAQEEWVVGAAAFPVCYIPGS